MKKKCPHCFKELPITLNSTWEWNCSECGYINTEHPAFTNCKNCGYSPQKASCPYCRNDVDLGDLFFNFIYHN